jgi:hypothetical protein
MAYSTADLASEVQAKLGDTSFSLSDLYAYANNTNRDVHTKHRFRYMQSTADFTTVTAQALLGTTPADLLTAYNLRLTDKQFASKLTFLTFDEFDTRFPQPTLTAPGVPYYWYTFAGNINIFPAPSLPAGLTGYGVELRYRKKPTTIVDGTTVPDVPEEFRQVMFLGMMKQAMERRQRYDVSQLLDQQYQDKLIDLVDAYGDGAFQDSDPYVIPTVSNGGL